MTTIRLTVGDWSGDGHSQMEDVMIESNLDHRQLQEAYKAGVAKCGYDMTLKANFDEYEDNSCPQELVDALRPFGYDINEDASSVDWMVDYFAETWLFIAKLGNPTFEWKILTPPQINIGGYGLFI